MFSYYEMEDQIIWINWRLFIYDDAGVIAVIELKVNTMKCFVNAQINKPLLLISTTNKVYLSTVLIFKQSLKMHVISIAFYTQLLIYNLNIKTCLCTMSGLGFSFKYI